MPTLSNTSLEPQRSSWSPYIPTWSTSARLPPAGTATAKQACFLQDYSGNGSFFHSQSRGVSGTENRTHARQRTLVKCEGKNRLEPQSGSVAVSENETAFPRTSCSTLKSLWALRASQQITACSLIILSFPLLSSLVSLEKLHRSKSRCERN